MATTSFTISTGTRREVKECCGTCQFWSAETRRIRYNGNVQHMIEVDQHENNYDAACELLQGRSSLRTYSRSCPKWKKWVSLD